MTRYKDIRLPKPVFTKPSPIVKAVNISHTATLKKPAQNPIYRISTFNNHII
nr:hypothetical protein [uncultured Helicobacter sp.]